MPKRFLAPKARQGDGSGYLNQPLRRVPEGLDQFDLADQAALVRAATRTEDEPEVISDDIADYAKSAKFYKTLQHQANVEAARKARPLLATEDRIRDAERRAKQTHRNLSGEFHVMRQMLERARRGGRREPPSLIARLERVESDLDGLDLDGRPLSQQMRKFAA